MFFYLIFTLMFCTITPFVSGQNYYIDTLNLGFQKSAYITIPTYSKKSHNLYEGGVYYHYYFPNDSVLLTIQSGVMVSKPMLNDTCFIITDKSVIMKNSRVVYNKIKGYSKFENNKFLPFSKKEWFFREDDYNEYGISIMYENVHENDIPKYDAILDNIKIFID